MTDKLLSDRGKTHGQYFRQAAVTQMQRELFRSCTEGWAKLTPVQKDALEMISVKISRILTGDPNHKDHWDDIAGYATLAGSGGYEPSSDS